jgi:hypothetical protein
VLGVFSATAPRPYFEHERDDPVEEFPLFLLGVLKLGHAVRYLALKAN